MSLLLMVKHWVLKTLMLVVAPVCLGGFVLYKTRVDIPAIKSAEIYENVDELLVKAEETKEQLLKPFASYFESEHKEEAHHEAHKIVVTSPTVTNVNLTKSYVCQIHSQRHIDIRSLEGGYLEQIHVKEGQTVKKGDLMFKIVPTLYQAKLDAEQARARLAQLEYNNTKQLRDQNVISENEVLLLEAKLSEAQSKAKLAGAELNFTNVVAPFDGIVDRLQEQLGSLIKEGDILTTLSDNSVMWVYFNVPEADYLEYMADMDEHKADREIELQLANSTLFNQVGKIGAIEAKFNNENGNLAFRADFPNPKRLLRHGQTGNVLIHRTLTDAIVIPQRAQFEILDKRYVYVVDQDDVVHQREITVQNEMDDLFVIKKGIEPGDRIVLEGLRQIRDGETVTYEFRQPEVVVADLKNHAE